MTTRPSAICQWHVNETHYLEAVERRACASTAAASIVQPLVEPLYHGQVAARSARRSSAKRRSGPHAMPCRSYWQAQPQAAGQDFEKFWRKCLHDGIVAGTRRFPRSAVDSRTVPPATPAAAAKAAASRSCSRPTRRCTTGALPTWAGCRSCRGRSRSSRGTTPPCCRRRRPSGSASKTEDVVEIPGRRPHGATRPSWCSPVTPPMP